jgi:hypothetical protein
VPFVCGGFQSGYSSRCFRYNFGADSWTQIGSMPYATGYMGFDYSPSWGLGIVFTMHIMVSVKQFTHRNLSKFIFPLRINTNKYVFVYLYLQNKLINFFP